MVDFQEHLQTKALTVNAEQATNPQNTSPLKSQAERYKPNRMFTFITHYNTNEGIRQHLRNQHNAVGPGTSCCNNAHVLHSLWLGYVRGQPQQLSLPVCVCVLCKGPTEIIVSICSSREREKRGQHFTKSHFSGGFMVRLPVTQLTYQQGNLASPETSNHHSVCPTSGHTRKPCRFSDPVPITLAAF